MFMPHIERIFLGAREFALRIEMGKKQERRVEVR